MDGPGMEPDVMQMFEDRSAASSHVAELISSSLLAQLQKSERASLVLSGGSSPVSCLQFLSQKDLPWNRIDITLTDERNVPSDHVDSNENMVCENMIVANAENANFVRLQEGAIDDLQPFACTLVGMGEDGHFASLFPDSPQLEEALVSTSELIEVTTPSSPHSRTSMTLNTLARSRKIILLVFGEAKRQILEHPDAFTVNHLLNRCDVTIVWAP
jgi:6-phosphogluconolactonase